MFPVHDDPGTALAANSRATPTAAAVGHFFRVDRRHIAQDKADTLPAMLPALRQP